MSEEPWRPPDAYILIASERDFLLEYLQRQRPRTQENINDRNLAVRVLERLQDARSWAQ